MIEGLELTNATRGAGFMGRMKTVKDLPPRRTLTGYIKQAMKLNDAGVTVPRSTTKRPALPVPPELAAALAKNKKAKVVFDAFTPSQKRDYNEWIGEAKRDQTRTARVKQAMEWIAEGKVRHWKYQR